MRILLGAGAIVTSRNKLGWTPLTSVAGNNEFGSEISPQNRVEVCRLLVSHGCEINARANDGTTALHRAVASKDNADARFLLDNGADVILLTDKGQSALHCACMAAVNEKSSWGGGGGRNTELDLITAALQNVRLLISHGADTVRGYIPEARGNDLGEWGFDFGPKESKYLFFAVADVCDLLVAEGANVEVQDHAGKSFRSLVV